MGEPPVEGITVRDEGGRVRIDVAGGTWEGTPAEAERVLTRLHYALARARPGTSIASVFVNGTLWGEKVIETDPTKAIRAMRLTLDRLARLLEEMASEAGQQGSASD